MHTTVLSALIAAAVLLQPITAFALPAELEPRSCNPNRQMYDPKGGLCHVNDGKSPVVLRPYLSPSLCRQSPYLTPWPHDLLGGLEFTGFERHSMEFLYNW